MPRPHLEGGKVVGGVVDHLNLKAAKLGGANLGQVDVRNVGNLSSAAAAGAGGGRASSVCVSVGVCRC